MLNWVYSWAKWYSKEENIKHRQLQMVQREAGRKESTSRRAGGVCVCVGGGGGGGLDLLITLIKSGHSDLFLLDWSKQTECFLC